MNIIFATPETHVFGNNSVLLSCIVEGNPPAKEVVWTKTNALYTLADFSMMENETNLDRFTILSSLTLPYVTLESRGNYTCVAYNEICDVEKFDEETISLFVWGNNSVC